jgi:arylesterase/paraoxonase
MRKLFRGLFKLLGLVLLVGVLFTAIVAWRGHFFRDVESRFAGTCEALPLEGSAEDIQLDRERGLAYLSVLDRLALVEGSKDVQGTVMKVDLSLKPLHAEPALLSQPDHFRPHGLSLYAGEGGRRYLFALNHPVNRGSEPEMLEIFEELTPGRFGHVATISDPLFVSPNDIVAVGPREAYVANDKATSTIGNVLQQIGIGGSPITYVNGDDISVVKSDIAAGGGIAATADGKTIYVTETAAQRVRVLARDPDDGSLTDVERIAVDTSPDNIDVAADGSLWIGAHANTLKLIQHFAQGRPAPSQVRRLQLQDGRSIRDVYLNDGREISASSVGVNYDNLLLVGSITARKLLVCTLPDEDG